jgi:hypothetical protein
MTEMSSGSFVTSRTEVAVPTDASIRVRRANSPIFCGQWRLMPPAEWLRLLAGVMLAPSQINAGAIALTQMFDQCATL